MIEIIGPEICFIVPRDKRLTNRVSKQTYWITAMNLKIHPEHNLIL